MEEALSLYQQLAIALGWAHHGSSNAYSEDLRKKIVEAKERGMPTVEVARTFGVGLSSVKRYARVAREGGSLCARRGARAGAPRPTSAQGGSCRSGPAGATRRHPLRESRVPAERGRGEGERLHRQQAAPSHGMDPKKRRVGASERDEFLRAAWRALVAGEIGAERLVFVEEMGSNTSLAALYAWSRRGDRARCSVPRNRAKRTPLLSWRA